MTSAEGRRAGPPPGLFRSDGRGAWVFADAGWGALTGQAAAAALGAGWLESVVAADRERVRAGWRVAVEAGAPFEAELLVRTASGEACAVTCAAAPERGPAGELLGHVGCFAAEAGSSALRESEERYRALVEHATEAIVVLDLETGRFREVNRNATRLFGLPREELLRLGPADLSPAAQPDGRPSVDVARERIAEAVAGGTPEFEWTHRDASGREVPCEVRLARLPGPGGRPLVRGCITDIRGRKRAEALRAGQRRVLEEVATGAPLAQALASICLLVEALTDAALCSVLLLDEDGRRLRHGAGPSLPPAYMAAIDGAEIGPRVGSCGTAAHEGRTVIVRDIETDPLWADYRGLAAAHGLRSCWSSPVISSAGAVLGTFAVYRRTPSSPTAEEERLIDGVTHLAAIAIERTRVEEARRRAEERERASLREKHQVEEQLRQAQRMEALGRLAGGVAHDFNNLLTAILANTELLLRSATPGPQRDGLTDIRQAVVRGAALTRQLLAFSRKQVLEPRVLDLNRVVRGLEGLLRRVMGEDVRLVVELASGLGRVRADAGQLEQVILNLVVNARDAVLARPDADPDIIIETLEVELDAAGAAAAGLSGPGPWVQLSVTDRGCGMDTATRLRLFEPFFTTKGPSQGTGLGLSTVYGIVRQSGGGITVETEKGKGSTFRVLLPRCADAPADEPTTGSARRPACGVETVLLVEDDDAVRAGVSKLLANAGYDVLLAPTGHDALRVAAAHAGTIHLLLTDTVMPGMSGTELTSRLRALRPDLKVLLVSGYPEEALAGRGAVDGAAFLAKPFTAAALAMAMRGLLDG